MGGTADYSLRARIDTNCWEMGTTYRVALSPARLANLADGVTNLPDPEASLSKLPEIQQAYTPALAAFMGRGTLEICLNADLHLNNY